MEDAKEGKRPHFVNKCKLQKFLLKALAQVTSAIETISIKPKLILYVFKFHSKCIRNHLFILTIINFLILKNI